MHTALRSALLAAGAVALASAPALAQQTCRDQIERFAAAENLSATSPPVTSPPAAGDTRSGTAGSTVDGGNNMSETLGRSGGVLAPPAVGDTAVIDPPRTGEQSMPTAPRIAPSPGAGSGSSGDTATGTTAERAAQRAQMESLVTAARAAADRGDERQCLESLDKARALTERRGTDGDG
ncbi:MAG TPA: hypothetical protein VD978_08735 [Azospirillum sp.]|nr:hypothetical protein [Azospirillum sp.]